MRNKILVALSIGFLVLYFSSYFLIREANRGIVEMGCPPEGCTIINFPSVGFYNIYRPLIGLEIFLLGTDFKNHGSEKIYSYE